MPQNFLPGLDLRDGTVYEMPDGMSLAVDVAVATGRPLLLRGEPGSGKSSLAPYLAREHGLRYYEQVVTSRTESGDLLWSFDHVRRLADAQAHNICPDAAYIRPGVLWWALAPTSAADYAPGDPLVRSRPDGPDKGALVLIDEIDKADPDMPNGLLVALGSQEFSVAETTIHRESLSERLLIVITTNEERELAPAFLRRCVTFEIPEPDERFLRRAALAHLSPAGDPHTADVPESTSKLIDWLANELVTARGQASVHDHRPSTAEFLDGLKACLELDITDADPRWAAVRDLAFIKPQRLGR